MQIEISKKGLVKAGKFVFVALPISIFLYFMVYLIWSALAAVPQYHTVTAIVTNNSPSNLTRNGSTENFTITVGITSGNVSNITITFPGFIVQSIANISLVLNNPNAISVNDTDYVVNVRTNFTTPTNAVRLLEITNASQSGFLSGASAINITFTAQAVINETWDNANQSWSVTIRPFNVSDSSEDNTTTLITFVDSRNPDLKRSTPFSGGFIYGTSTQNFSIMINDSNLNVSNVSLNWRVQGAPVYRKVNSSTAGELSCSGGANFTCGVNLNIDGNATNGDILEFYWEASDIASNFGNLGTSGSPLTTTVDKTTPTISGINEPSDSQTYAKNKNYTFSATVTDNNAVGTVLIENNFTSGGTFQNSTVSVLSGSVYAINFTDIGAGTYHYKWIANDTVQPPADNSRNTINSSNTSDLNARNYFTIALNATNPVDFFLNGTIFSNLTVVYPAQVNATALPTLRAEGQLNASTGNVRVYRNSSGAAIDTDVTSLNATNVRLGNATYRFIANITQGTNYTANATGAELYVFILKGNITLRVGLNGTEANRTYTYPQAINASANITAPNSESQYNLTLYRDGVSVATTNTGIFATQEIRLANATYNFTAIFNGSTNYTDVTISDNRFAFVNKGGTVVNTFLNGSRANITIKTGQLINVSTNINTTLGLEGTLRIDRNGTVIHANTTSIWINNETLTFSGRVGSSFNITGYYIETANYTASSETFYVIVETTPPRWLGTFTNVTNNSIIGRSNTNVNISINWTDNFELDYWWFGTNGTGTETNATFNKFAGPINNSNRTVDVSSFTLGGFFFVRVYANDTNANENSSQQYWFTIDGTAPQIFDVNPVNFTYINGTSSQNFSVRVRDDTLDLNNVTLHWRRLNPSTGARTGWTNRTTTCSGTNPTYTCSFGEDLSGAPNNHIIEYLFDADDNSTLGNTSGTFDNPYNVTIDRSQPTWTNQLQRVTSGGGSAADSSGNITVGRLSTLRLAVNWTDNQNLSYAWLETNESGTIRNYTNTQRVNFSAGGNQWSNFTWTNTSLALGTFFEWRVWANDTLGNTNITDRLSITIESTAPQFTTNLTNVTNNTIVTRRQHVNITAVSRNNIELDRWWVQNNGTGTLTNTSGFAFGTGNNSNYSLDVSSFTRGGFWFVRIFANDTSGIENSTMQFWFTTDGTVPQPTGYTVNQSNNTLIGRNNHINISSNWTDKELHGWRVEHNLTATGSVTNTSFQTFLVAALNNSNLTIDVSSIARGFVFARIIANDTSGNENATEQFWWTVDSTAPQWMSPTTTNVTNSTVIAQGTSVNISANWTENKELNVWWAQYNGTGTLTNTTRFGFVGVLNNSNITVNTSNFTRGEFWFVRLFANDTSGNENSTQQYWFRTDGDAPTIENISTTPANNTQYRSGATYHFNVSVNDSVGVANVTFETNITGTLSNYTLTTTPAVVNNSNNNYSILFQDFRTAGTGNYTFRWIANDTSNNIINSSTVVVFRIAQNATNPINLFLNGTYANSTNNVTIVYPAQTNVTATAIYTTSGTIGIFRDTSTDVTSQNNTNVRLGNATYTFRANITGNNNYSTNETGVTIQAFVLKGSVSIFLGLNGTEADRTYVYPQAINASGNITAPNSESQYNLSLFRNGTIVSSTTAGIFATQEILLGNETYNYTIFFNSSANYSTASVTRIATVQRGGILLNLSLNGTQANRTYTYPDAVNATAFRNSTFGESTVNMTLLRDGVVIGSVLTTSTSENIRLAGATYNYSVTVDGGANYTNTSIVVDRFATVNAGSANITLTMGGNQSNGTIEQGVSINFTTTINTTIDSVTLNLSINISGWATNTSTGTSPSISNTTATSTITVANFYNVTASFAGTANYSATSRTVFLNISSDVTAPSITIFFQNGTMYSNFSYNKSNDIVRLNISVSDSGVGMASTQNASVFINDVFAGNVTRTASGWYNGTVTVPSASSVGSDGNKTLKVNISDTNGNVGANASFVITIDNTAPSIAFTYPNNGTYVKADSSGFIWINGTVFDNILMGTGNVSINGSVFSIFSFNGGNNSAFAFRNSSAVAENRVNITVSYNDSVNNNGTNSSLLFFVDNTAPSTAIGLTNSSSGTKYSPTSSQTIQVLLTDNLQTNRTITLNYKYPGTNSPWNTTLMTGTPAATTVYSGTIDTSELVSNQNVSYYITGVDNATNDITASVGGSASSPLGRITIEVNTTGAIDGYVVANDTGAGVSDATVSTSEGAAVSTSNGYYKISNLPSGTYTLTTTKSGWITNTTSSISVTAGTTTRQNVTLRNNNTGVIQGYIRSNDTTLTFLSGVTVSDGTRAAVSDTNGFYQIAGVPGGTYTVTASRSGYLTNSSSSNAVNPSGTTNVNITLPNNNTGTMNGYVYLTNTSSTVTNSSVRVSDGTRTTFTNNAGYYTITGAPGGTYTLTVGGNNGYWTNTTTVTIPAGGTTSTNIRVTGAESFNVTLPGTSGSSLTGFWEPGWRDFYFRTGMLSDSTTNYTVERLFQTVGISGSYNFTSIWRYNATSQTYVSYIPGAAGNTLVNISSSSDLYWIFMNSTDRVELEARYR